MTVHTSYRAFLRALLVFSCGACSSEGTDTTVQASHRHPSVTIWTDSVELFFEHPDLVAGEATEAWAVHLTSLATFEPVADGELNLRFTAPDGTELVETAPSPSAPGIFTPMPSFATGGMYDLVMELRSQQTSTDVFVGPVFVWESADDIPVLEDEEPVA